ncbi:Alpha/Beta hydrolase protein [Truncatella angustata]|uniref:Alpha/Beta hydrolase protein n=1 Tax=Truncatella angustata TaxID=152316 RepID=A0A9P8UC49_9PEZI|nr:Alpha/Beta hydrolase protein [Truncatella angustata]KAH6646952.1 Alpha/Beta hydrolase protein [Truncatella angustata]
MPVPFIGRLNPTEYVALVGSFCLVGLEAIIRILTLALPNSLLQLFYGASRRLFNRYTSPKQKKAQEHRKSLSTSIQNASDFVDLCAAFGYTAEEHVVQTKDGYLLGVHRLAWRRGEEDMKVNSGPNGLNGLRKKVIYMHHGLLMNSEVWVCLTDPQRCLPFVLVDRGYDVWLGNNRGNKYSKKSIKTSPQNIDFWNFSIDEFAFHDIPDTISYILESTKQPSLSYIGFSQGTAQSFASLAIHPKLNEQVNVFIALAPAMSPAGLSNGIVDALIKASPQVLFLLFGRRSILASATMWQSILYPPIFVRLIDMGLDFLFGWKARNISMSQKLAAYPHLYSFTSTKSVVHWFQIIRNKSFQMYDDDVHPPLSNASKYTKVAKYPTRNIKTPVVLVYGGSDSLVDIKVMLRELPNRTVATEIPHYEHLDFLWARDVDTQVFQHVFDALDNFTDAEHSKEEFESYRRARHLSLGASASFRHHRYRNSDALESDSASGTGLLENKPDPAMAHHARENNASPALTAPESLVTDTSGTTLTNLDPEPEPEPEPSYARVAAETPPPSSPSRVTFDRGVETPVRQQRDTRIPSPTFSNVARGSHRRRGSTASNLSFDSPKDGRGKGGGIRIGTSKPIGGLVSGASSNADLTASSGDEGSLSRKDQ